MAQDDRDYWYQPKLYRGSKARVGRADVERWFCLKSFSIGVFLTCGANLLIPKIVPYLIYYGAIIYFMLLDLIGRVWVLL